MNTSANVLKLIFFYERGTVPVRTLEHWSKTVCFTQAVCFVKRYEHTIHEKHGFVDM